MKTKIVSADYRQITEDTAMADQHADAWRDQSIPAQQLALTDAELVRWNAGESIAPFDALRSCMQAVAAGCVDQTGVVFEIGCGVGHNADVVKQSGDFMYVGADYSEEFIRVAMARRPNEQFVVMDALMLDYPEKLFECVVSGCCILHIVGWRTALSEAARVARRWVVLHRTPITQNATTYYFKKAYGVDCVELEFNEPELLIEMMKLGFRLHSQYPVQENNITYLFERATT